MRDLITGGAGFIGSHLCDRLLREGHAVLCVDNFLTGSRDNLTSHEANPRFTLLSHDISEPLEAPGPVDFVLHLASPASPPDYLKHPISTLKVGSFGTYHALEIARAKGAPFLFASTSEVYGDPEEHPQRESYWGRVNPVGPRSVYDEAKRFSEALTMATHRTHGLDTRIIRIFNTYGPRMRREDGRAIPNFIVQALENRPITLFGDGSQTRSFCYVTDLVEGIFRVMGSGLHEPVNLGHPQETSLLELARIILRLTGSSSRIVYRPLPVDDPKVRCPDIARARKELDWSPTVSLEQGLAQTIAWFKSGLSA